MSRPLLSLVCILRNEAASIRALLDSVVGAVDHVTILDTGSTDDTQKTILESTDKERNLRLSSEPFVPFRPLLAETPSRHVIDFAATRNRALELEAGRAEPAVFTLMLSGDETLHGGAELRAFLEQHRDAPEGAYSITMQRDQQTWPYTRILRVDSGWRYRFPIHEAPVGPNGETMGPMIPGVRILYAPKKDDKRLAERHRNVDLPVLEYLAKQTPVTHEDHISRARALLFLAQTHEMLALEFDSKDPTSEWVQHQYAALSYYSRRAHLEGDPVDMHYALFHFFEVASRLGLYSHEEMVTRLQGLAEIDPDRPEVRYRIAMHAAQIDARKAAFFANEAVKVARAAKTKNLPFSTDARIEWLSLQIAAEAASIMKMSDSARKLAEQGIAAGGPREAFADYLGA